MRSSVVALFLLLSTIATAICPPSFRALVETVDPSARYALPIGGAVKLDLGKGDPVAAVFMGRLVSHDGVAREWAFYEKEKDLLHVIPAAEIVARGPAGEIPTRDLEPMVKNTAQVGGTCAAFTLFHCFMLMKHQGRLSRDVPTETEADRYRLLGKITSTFYGRGTTLENTISAAGRTAVDIATDTRFNGFKDRTVASAQQGDPIVLIFNLRPWEKRAFKTVQYLSEKDELTAQEMKSSGHWLPTRPLKWWQYLIPGYQKSGRHAVMIRGVVEGPNGTRKLWVSDPNFEYPVLWDVSELDHARAANMATITLAPVHQLTDADEEK